MTQTLPIDWGGHEQFRLAIQVTIDGEKPADAQIPKPKCDRRAYHREYRRKNAVRLRSHKQAYYRANRSSTRAKHRAYYAAHKDEIKGNVARYNQANRPALYARIRRWKRKNPAKTLAYTRHRQARQLGLTTNPQAVLQFTLRVKSKRAIRCYYCGKVICGKRTHIDHIIPLVLSGLHDVGNLCAACPQCNLSKGTKPLGVWQASGQQVLPI